MCFVMNNQLREKYNSIIRRKVFAGQPEVIQSLRLRMAFFESLNKDSLLSKARKFDVMREKLWCGAVAKHIIEAPDRKRAELARLEMLYPGAAR